MDYKPTRRLCPWDFPGKNTGVGCQALLQVIFLTPGLNSSLLCLLHCRQILYHCATWEAPELLDHKIALPLYYEKCQGKQNFKASVMGR